VENRADAARGQISRRKGVQGVFVIQLRIQGALARGCKSTSRRYGGRRSGSRLRHSFTGVAPVRPWSCRLSPKAEP